MSLSPEAKAKIIAYIRSGDCPTYLLPVYRWWLQRREEQICPSPTPTVWFLLGGRGCIAAGTPIWDPVRKENVPVEDRDVPGWVLAMTPQGPQPVMASASFKKGEAELFEVRTATGDVIRVTAEHRFLTPSGWKHLREIGVGDVIACDPSSPQGLTSGDRHSSRTTQDSRADNHPYYSVTESIRPLGVGPFYDLTVPEHENYLAANIWNHNSGKTHTASNHIYEYCVNLPHTIENRIIYVALVGSTFDDVKNTMVEGISGLLNVIPEENLIAWNRTVGELKFFIRDGENYREVRANTYTSERPEKLRGPNTHVAWLDEMAKFKDADVDPTKAGTTFSNMMMGLRLGTKPHVVVTGTPTPCKLVRYLLEHPDSKLSHMTTFDNRKNLPESFLAEFTRLRPDSRTYRQEVLAEVLLDNPDAIFSHDVINENRAAPPEDALKTLKVLGYDPSVSSSADSDECGIMLCAYTPEVKQATKAAGGRPMVITPTHAYILKDLSGHYTPTEQTRLVIRTVLNEHVDDLVFEQNQGVEFVMGSLEQAVKDNSLEYKIRKNQKAKKTDYGVVKRWAVSGVDKDNQQFKFNIYAIHAVSGKQLRAEMVSTRYESNQVHHPKEALPTCQVNTCGANLEVQMTSWDPSNTKMSPDRLDAMVYCLLHIFSGNILTKSKVTIARPPADVTQMTSEHGAVKRRRRGAGIYSADIASGNPSDQADRSLMPRLMEGGTVSETSYLYSRDVV